ncbi:MAG: hypothetical protein K0R66_44 [Gammaproteobacteria bacterium]|jgi:hypothetical protein|nr:hypothetical protein [Gammaproteobacteria bacterium]
MPIHRQAQALKPLHYLLLSLPVILIAIIFQRYLARPSHLMEKHPLPMLPQGYRLDSEACKPIIEAAMKPGDVAIAFTPKGPMPAACILDENGKACQTEQTKLMQFIEHKAPANRARLSKARDKARIEYETQAMHLEHALKSHKAFVEQVKLRLKEFIVAEMALSQNLGNCAEFTAIQIALRLIQANETLASLQRVTVEFSYNGMSDSHVFLQRDNTICDAYNNQNGPIDILSSQFVMYKPKHKKTASRKVLEISSSLYKPEGLSQDLYNTAISIENKARANFIKAFVARFEATLNQSGKAIALRDFPVNEASLG